MASSTSISDRNGFGYGSDFGRNSSTTGVSGLLRSGTILNDDKSRFGTNMSEQRSRFLPLVEKEKAPSGKITKISDLHEKMADVGQKIKSDLSAITQKDQNVKLEHTNLIGEYKDRKGDTNYIEEKVLERIFGDDKARDVGAISCMTICNKKEVLIIGTKKMHVIYFNYKLNQFKLMKLKTKGAITCVDLNKTSEYVAVGGEAGAVFLLQLKAKDNSLEQIAKAEGFSKESIRDIKFTDSGLNLVALDYAEQLFHLPVNPSKSKPTYEVQVIPNATRGAKLCSLKVFAAPRVDGLETKVRFLYVGGFHHSLMYRFGKGSFVQLESFEQHGDIKPNKSINGSLMNEDEGCLGYCIEDYDILPWIAPVEVKLLYLIRGTKIWIRFLYLNESEEIELTNFSECRFSDAIIYASLITPGLLLVVDSYSQIKFIDMRKIVKSQREKKEVDFGTGSYVSLKSTKLKDEAMMFAEEPFGRAFKNYLPFITGGSKGRFLLIATAKKLIYFELRSWESYLEELDKGGDKLSVIQLLGDICDGEYYKLYGISPNKERRKMKMSQWIVSFVDKCIRDKWIETSSHPSTMIRFVASLLVRTGNIEYLFDGFFQSMQIIGMNDELVRIIEEYIKSDQMGSFGPESLNSEFMGLFTDELKKKLLVECFESSDEKRGQVISLVYPYKFYDLMFYMCTKHDPVSCLFPVSLLIIDIENTQRTNPQRAQDLLVQLFWYCDNLMRGVSPFSDSSSSENSKIKEMQVIILEWVIDPKNVKIIVETDHLYYFDLILGGLSEVNMVVYQEHLYNLQSSSLRSTSKLQDTYQYKILNESSLKNFDILLEELRMSLAGPRLPDYALFMACLMLLGLPKIRLEGNTIESISTILISKFEAIETNPRIKLTEEQIQSLVFDIFTTNTVLLKQSKEFSAAAENSSNVFKVMMLETKDRCEETFTLYLKLVKDKPSHSQFFFQWLTRVFSDKSDKKGSVADIASLIPEHFGFLIELGKKESLSLWDFFENPLKIETIRSIQRYPKPQLEFLKKLMKLGEKKETKLKVPDDLKILFFDRLCELEPEEVLAELKKNQLPTNQCLEICQKHSVELGAAYLNERLGKYTDALDIYILRFIRFATEFRAKIAGKAEKYFFEAVHNEEVKDGNLFKIHPECSQVSYEYLMKLEDCHKMFLSLSKSSDNPLEVETSHLSYATSGSA